MPSASPKNTYVLSYSFSARTRRGKQPFIKHMCKFIIFPVLIQWVQVSLYISDTIRITWWFYHKL